jgi:type IV protein arginine methyltransferase
MVQVTVSEDLQFAFRLHSAIINMDKNSDVTPIKALINVGGANEFTWHVDEFGQSPLHLAASKGLLQVVQLLIQAGNPWNALNDNRKTAAELALENGHEDVYDFLLQEAVRSEMILNCVGDIPSEENTTEGPQEYGDYLNNGVTYEGKDLLANGNSAGVMMEWERPLMKRHASLLCDVPETQLIDLDCPSNLDCMYQTLCPPTSSAAIEFEDTFRVLNVGFGLGLVDSYLHQCLLIKAKQNPSIKYAHYIIEAHDQVYGTIKNLGWLNKTETSSPVEVRVLHGKWQDQVEVLLNEGINFDAIYFDTFGEYYKALQVWNEHVVNLLKWEKSSVYSFFNGLGGTNDFFNRVYSEIVEIELSDMGLEVERMELEIGEQDYSKVERPYFNLKTYRLLNCRPLQC